MICYPIWVETAYYLKEAIVLRSWYQSVWKKNTPSLLPTCAYLFDPKDGHPLPKIQMQYVWNMILTLVERPGPARMPYAFFLSLYHMLRWVCTEWRRISFLTELICYHEWPCSFANRRHEREPCPVARRASPRSVSSFGSFAEPRRRKKKRLKPKSEPLFLSSTR